MKILVDGHLFDDNIHQGTRTYLRGLYNDLVNFCPEITFYFACSNFEYIRSEIPIRQNVEYLKLRFKNKVIRLLLEFSYLIIRHKIDYAHFQYIAPVFKFSKEILTVHDLLFLDFPEYFPLQYRLIKNFLFKRSARRAEILLTVSEYSKQAIARHYKIKLQNIHVTPNGVSPSLIQRVNATSKRNFLAKYGLEKFILFVSRIEPRKNHINLLRAFAELKLWKEYDLVFVGKRSIEVHELDEFWKQQNPELRSRVKHYESVSDEDLAHFYSTCSLFVFPSFAEGFGIPPIEAVLFKAKVLCSNQTAMSDFVFLGDHLFNPNNYEEMKSRIVDQLQSDGNSASLTFFKEYVLQKYSWEYSAQTLKSWLT